MLRRLLFVFLALAVSGGTVVAARSWLQAQLAAREAPPVVAEAPKPAATVLVAKTDLPAGQFVRPENLSWQPWPEDGIAENYIVPDKAKLEDFVGAVVRSGLVSGEPIVDGKVVRPGDRGFMAAVLTPGQRAVTVTVTPSSGLAGFVFPGDHVDVVMTLTIPEEKEKDRERRASETVLTDIRVLAVDQRADDQKKEVAVAKTATLEVSSKQAEVIAVASEMGKLSLSLRSLAQDENAAPTGQATHTWDFEAARALQRPAAPDTGRPVVLGRGTQKTDVEVKGGVR
jgi:pilus assembly protein CpaB